MAVDSLGATLRLLFEDEDSMAALDLSSLIFDLNRLYVLALRFPNGDRGSVQEFSNYGRNSYRISKDLRLDVARIHFDSPGLIELTTAAVTGTSAIWILVQNSGEDNFMASESGKAKVGSNEVREGSRIFSLQDNKDSARAASKHAGCTKRHQAARKQSPQTR